MKPKHHKPKIVLPPGTNVKDTLLPVKEVERLMGVHKEGLSPWRIFKIMAEFVSGYEFIRNYKRAVTFFGSARMGFGHAVYKDAEKLAYDMAKEGFAVITGGGPGVMEAANK